MYNPFKWHIIKYRNRFILRKLVVLGFIYLDKTDKYKWLSIDTGWTYGGFNTKTDAQVLLLSLKVERV
jgi:hypothetical protein